MQRVHHIGVAVKDLDDALKVYQTFLEDPEVHREEAPEQKVKVAAVHLGDTSIELLEPTSDESPIAKFISKKGTGIHHICIEVDDLEKALQDMKDAGYRLIDEKPRQGAMGMKIAFLHPKSTNGVLLELSQCK